MKNITTLATGTPSEFRVQPQDRLIGSQFTEWSCFPASIEYLSYFKLNRRSQPFLQENIVSCSTWSSEQRNGQTVFRTLMPYDLASSNAIISAFQLNVHSNVPVSNQPLVISNFVALSAQNTGRLIFILNSNNFFGRPQLRHSTAIETINPNFCRLVIPVQPTNDVINNPIWGDIEWSDIENWNSEILILGI
jgi:hypothetical protein